MKSPLSIVSSKLSPLSQLILLFHFSTTRHPLYIFLVIILKYIAITSIVSSFSIKITSFSKTDFGGAELKKFLKEKEFNVLTQNVEFMLSAVQSTVYATFRVDYMKVKQNLARTMIITNLLMICIQLLSNIIIYILLLYLRNKIIYVHYGSIKFNDSFNKSLKYCN